MKRVLIPVAIVFVATVIIIIVLLKRAVGEIEVDNKTANYGDIDQYYNEDGKVDEKEEKDETLYDKYFGEDDEEKEYNKEFGSYAVLKEFEESKKYSTNNKFFYISKDDENKEIPDNIAINVESNNFAKADYQQFKNSIINQLSSNYTNKNINVSEDTTKSGDKVYTFTINNNNVKTICYYIVGNYKYVLIQETSYGTSNKIDEVALKMAKSFKWN